MVFNFSLITIGSISGIGSLLILTYKVFMKRYSFFVFAKDKQNSKHLLPRILYKAVFENYKFVEMNKYIAVRGYTEGNAWLKPYKCYPDIHSVSSFKNENEAFIYRFDSFLFFMIRLAKYFNKIPKDMDFLIINERANKQYKFDRITFYKNKNEIPQEI